MSNHRKPLNSWGTAHPHLQDRAAHPSNEPDFANNSLIMHVDLREKCRTKRERLPTLPPCEILPQKAQEKSQLSQPLLSRKVRALQEKSKSYFQSLLFPSDAVVVRLNESTD